MKGSGNQAGGWRLEAGGTSRWLTGALLRSTLDTFRFASVPGLDERVLRMRIMLRWILCGGLMTIGMNSISGDEPDAKQSGNAKVLRAGIIGLDTSHAPAFAELLNGPKAEGDLAGVRIVAAFPGGSPDIPASADRVKGYTEQLA